MGEHENMNMQKNANTDRDKNFDMDMGAWDMGWDVKLPWWMYSTTTCCYFWYFGENFDGSFDGYFHHTVPLKWTYHQFR